MNGGGGAMPHGVGMKFPLELARFNVIERCAAADPPGARLPFGTAAEELLLCRPCCGSTSSSSEVASSYAATAVQNNYTALFFFVKHTLQVLIMQLDETWRGPRTEIRIVHGKTGRRPLKVRPAHR